MPESLLQQVRVVLLEPQDPVNIGATVRVMKNMGVDDLRLVRPCAYDPWRIEGIAHGTRDIVERIRHHDTLDEALADCVRVAAFAGKRRAAKWMVHAPREAAPDLLAHAGHGPVALLFGREDWGLPKEALDKAQLTVHIPTTEHASLNLAQAVLVGLYELHLASGDATRRLKPPRKDAPPATNEQYEQFFTDAARALDTLNFFKTRFPEYVMRTVRSIAFRAGPDAREIQLFRAMAIEVVRSFERARVLAAREALAARDAEAQANPSARPAP
ncbi:MAG: RNA methyltransferase [Gemmatimonadetes bacterium]|nr:RNA methyltransferase [Gemmatimonadota bacterium]